MVELHFPEIKETLPKARRMSMDEYAAFCQECRSRMDREKHNHEKPSSMPAERFRL